MLSGQEQAWQCWKRNLVQVPEASPVPLQKAQSRAGSTKGRTCTCTRSHTHAHAHTQSPYPFLHISLTGTRLPNFLFDACLFTIPKTGPSFRKTGKRTTHFARTTVQEGMMVNFRHQSVWVTGCADVPSHIPWDVSMQAVWVEMNT